MIDPIKAISLAGIIKTRYGKKRNPVVFVPGLYGSMGDTIISGTGDWSFGISSSVYEPFINQLIKMGYEMDETLFICFYDWRKDCRYCMEKYLKPMIYKAKKRSRCKKVDIICHSMGGLVARSYIQSRRYRYDIDKAIFIATPHTGAANAYSFWTEGKLLSKNSLESQLFTMIVEGYLWILTRFHNYSNELDAIHDLLPGALNLIPSKDYGEYIYFFDDKKNIEFIPYDKMNYQNTFLDNLNNNKELLKRRGVDTTVIVGQGVSTNTKFQVQKNKKTNKERIVSVQKTDNGDGTVVFNSSTAIEGDTYVLRANHTEILNKAIFIVRNKLGIAGTPHEKDLVDSKGVQKHTSILINGKGNLKVYLKTSQITKLLYDGAIKDKDIYVGEYNQRLKWLIIPNVDEKQLVIDYEAEDRDTMDIQMISHSGKKIKFLEENPMKGHNYRMKLD